MSATTPQGESEYIHHTYNARASPGVKTDSQSRTDTDLNTSLHTTNTDTEQFYRPLRLSYLQHIVDTASAQNTVTKCTEHSQSRVLLGEARAFYGQKYWASEGVSEYRGQDVNRPQWISRLSPNDSAPTWETSTGPPEHKSIPVSAELTAKVAKMRLSQGNHYHTRKTGHFPSNHHKQEDENRER